MSALIIYLIIGILVLGVFGILDDHIRDLKGEINFETVSRPILAILIWPIWVLVFLMLL